jgi:hypothetical protein
MRAVKQKLQNPYVSPTTAMLLTELGDECQHIVKLLAQLDLADLSEPQVEHLLGELSASILHLHEHTRGLDAILDEDGGLSK